MIKNILILLALLGVITGATYVTEKSSLINPPFTNIPLTNSATKPIIMQDFDFIDLHGRTHTFYDYSGRTVIIHFWATWCAPCLAEFPDLVKLAQQNPDNLTLITIVVADEIPKIEKFMKTTKLNPPNNMVIGLDPQKHISEKIFNTVKLPESYIFTHSLHLKERIIGAYDRWLEYQL